jgi:hypothetical protein
MPGKHVVSTHIPSGFPTPSWCAWRWPRCCWAPGRSITGADVLHAARAPVPLPAQAARVPQAGQGRRAAYLQTMLYLASLCPSSADGLRLLDATPGTVRRLAAGGPPLRAGRVGELLRLMRCSLPLALGLELYLLTTAGGMPVAWCPADPKIGEREAAAELLGHARDTGALRDQMR